MTVYMILQEILGLDPEDSDDDEIRAIKAQLRRIKRVHGAEAMASDLEDEEGEGDDEEKGNKQHPIV